MEALEKRVEWLRKERQRLEDAYRSQRELNDVLLAVRAIGQAERMKRVRTHLDGMKLRMAEEKIIADTRPFGTRVGPTNAKDKRPVSDTGVGDGCATGCSGGDSSWGK